MYARRSPTRSARPFRDQGNGSRIREMEMNAEQRALMAHERG
jgi:hypothetical protein